MRVRLIAKHLAAAVLVTIGLAQSPRAQESVTVFAAASLKNALEEVAKPFTAATGIRVRYSFAASSALARQIEQGAPADLFASADVEWMDFLAGRNLVREPTRIDLLGNKLVVIALADNPMRDLELTPKAVQDAVGGGRIAVGEVASVPAGRYAKAALEKLGLWRDVQPRLAQVENVRGALLLVSRGEAPLGIVYETDAKADPKVKVVATFPASSHPPIVYPFAVTTRATGEAASRFLAFLRSAEARKAFEAQGFTLIDPPRASN